MSLLNFPASWQCVLTWRQSLCFKQLISSDYRLWSSCQRPQGGRGSRDQPQAAKPRLWSMPRRQSCHRAPGKGIVRLRGEIISRACNPLPGATQDLSVSPQSVTVKLANVVCKGGGLRESILLLIAACLRCDSRTVQPAPRTLPSFLGGEAALW